MWRKFPKELGVKLAKIGMMGLAIPDSDPTQRKGCICVFVVEREFPELSMGKAEDKMGLDASPTNEIVFDNCLVPKDNLMVREGEAFKRALRQFGRSIIPFQGIQWMFADMTTRIDAARLLLYNAA